jgi:hypothetical protein
MTMSSFMEKSFRRIEVAVRAGVPLELDICLKDVAGRRQGRPHRCHAGALDRRAAAGKAASAATKR